jgi:hypothetical protein
MTVSCHVRVLRLLPAAADFWHFSLSEMNASNREEGRKRGEGGSRGLLGLCPMAVIPISQMGKHILPSSAR